MPLSRADSEVSKKAGGKGLREFVIFLVEKYGTATFLLEFHLFMNDLNDK